MEQPWRVWVKESRGFTEAVYATITIQHKRGRVCHGIYCAGSCLSVHEDAMPWQNAFRVTGPLLGKPPVTGVFSYSGPMTLAQVFRWPELKQIGENIEKLPVIWDASTLICRHSNIVLHCDFNSANENNFETTSSGCFHDFQYFQFVQKFIELFSVGC